MERRVFGNIAVRVYIHRNRAATGKRVQHFAFKFVSLLLSSSVFSLWRGARALYSGAKCSLTKMLCARALAYIAFTEKLFLTLSKNAERIYTPAFRGNFVYGGAVLYTCRWSTEGKCGETR